MLRRLEKLTCLLAALAALLVEVSFIYCIRQCPATGSTGPWVYTASWLSPTLPQSWLAGAVVARFYHLRRLAEPNAQKALQSRRSFLRLWYWFPTLAATQGLDLYVNHARMVRH